MGKLQLYFQYPPNLEKSEKHRLANRIFKGVQKNPVCDECQCCDRKLGVQELDLSCCYDNKDLAFLGPGIPLLFGYLRNSIILLVVFTLIFSVYCIYSNVSESYCNYGSTDCQHNIFNTISFVNKINNGDLLSIQNYIVVTFVVINIIMFQCFRYNFRKIQQQCDEIINSPSDYAIILRRLPENVTKQDIQKMVEQRRTTLNEQERYITDNLKVDHILLSYYMGKYTKVKQSNMDKLKQLIDDKKQNQFKPQPLPKLTQTAKLAIVVFTRQQSKTFFLDKPDIFQRIIHFFCDPCTPLSNFQVKGERISIERAPEPDDVVWQNSKISIQGAIIRKLVYNFLGIIILFLGGFSQYWLAVLQGSITDETIKQLLSLGLSILVAIFNFIILQFLIFSSQKQRNETLTEFNTVLTVKITFFQFLNTGIFVVLANFLADIKNFTITQTFTTDVTIIMVTNALTPNLSLWILNYFQITGKIFRCLVKSDKMKVTQMEANQIWQGPLAQIPYKYAYVLKTLWLTAFYSPLVPIVVPISIIGLLMNYFIEKYLYRFSYSVPNMLSSMVNDSAIELMEYFPLIMSLGEFIVYIYITNYDPASLPVDWSGPIYISIVLSLLNILLPMDKVNQCIQIKNDEAKSPRYDEVQHKFEVTYQMTNPAYDCKKKRKRDIFLFNQIFGGAAQAKDVAHNLSGFLGLNQSNREMMKDPLISKNFIKGTQEKKNQNILEALNQQDQNPGKKQGQNPFAKFMHFNKIAQQNQKDSQEKKKLQEKNQKEKELEKKIENNDQKASKIASIRKNKPLQKNSQSNQINMNNNSLKTAENTSDQNYDIYEDSKNNGLSKIKKNYPNKTMIEKMRGVPHKFSDDDNKFTNSNILFYQKSQQARKRYVPHVEVHVPLQRRVANQKSHSQLNSQQVQHQQDLEKKKRKADKDYKDYNRQGEIEQQLVPKKKKSSQKQQYKPEEIYSPRLDKKKPTDISQYYGPPKYDP